MRIGIGYDVHKLVKGRKLYLGGVLFENSEFGLLGHSDADVLIHALMDAMLGAAGLKDIGTYFSDKDEQYRGIRSTELLRQVVKLIKMEGYVIENIDTIVIGEYPRVAPKIDEIKVVLAEILEVGLKQIGIKATTEEGMGFTGRQEGVKAEAVVLLKNK